VFYRTGDFWIIKSDELSIQGRFQATNWTKANDMTDFSSMTGLIIKGSLIGNHEIEVKPLDYEGQISCDGEPILENFGNKVCGPASMGYTSNGDLIDDAMAFLPHKVLHVFLPRGIVIQCNRWPNFMNAQVTMSAGTLGAVDGVCGNFNGDQEDDEGQHIHERWGKGLSDSEVLFQNHIPMYIPTKPIPAKKCPEEKRAKAEKICKTMLNITSGWDFADCMGNVCVEGNIPSEAQGYTCTAGDDELAAMSWSEAKKEWCCKYEKVQSACSLRTSLI